MASLIRTRLSDLCTPREVGTLARKLFCTTVPQDENLPTCAPSGLEPHPGASALISTPRSKQPGHQDLFFSPFNNNKDTNCMSA